jgi:hypothetical protein
LPLTWDIIFIINSFDRANRLACTAIDTFVRLDVEHPSTVINAINGALFAAGLIFNVHARFGDYICHERSSRRLEAVGDKSNPARD